MYQIKTSETDKSVIDYVNRIENQRRRSEALQLISIFEETTGFPAKMWGESMIGFGSYHYKYATGHEGDAMKAGFSPRKAKISLYLNTSFSQREELLERLGKHTTGVSCIYVNKLEDIKIEVLKEMITKSLA